MQIFLAVALLYIDLACARGFNVGQTVKTTSGDITGKPSSWKPEVSEYLGIPFAEPPVGKLRWAASVAIKAPGKAINATTYRPSCLSKLPSDAISFMNSQGIETGPMSEDCLYLNVWAKPQSGEKKKAVMVWIDGRAFVVGGGSNKAYDGALLADENDVIVVNMNYRMGVLGFANAYYMEAANFGLHDQRMAVEWVRDNIEAFGGDPSRITLFGQSAGSSSIDYYTFAWQKDPIAHAFILQSGTEILMAGTENFEHWSKGYQSLDCGKLHTAETIMACMRNKTSEEVMNAFSGLGFGPSTDWKLVHKEMGPLLAAGNYIQKPTLIGHTAYESDTFAHRTIIKRPYPPVQLSNNKTAIVNETQNALINESFLICSIGRLAKARTAKKIPTWLYTYAGDFPNQKTSPNMTTKPWHGSEVGLIFGTTSFTRLLPDTTEQTELAKKMREAWTSFAKAPETGLDKLKWPKYDPSASTVITLGGQNSSKISFTSALRFIPACLPMMGIELLAAMIP